MILLLHQWMGALKVSICALCIARERFISRKEDASSKNRKLVEGRSYILSA